MTALTVTASAVALVRADEDGLITGPCGEALTAGQWARLNATTGRIELGKATTEAEAADGGIAIHGAAVGMPVTLCRVGLVDLGNALSALNFGAVVFLSDTDGTLADATGTVTKQVGVVEAGNAATSADKLLRVSPSQAFTPA